MSRKARPCSIATHVADTGAAMHFIMGGCLSEDEAWVPVGLLLVDNDYYLPLSKKDTKLSAFCGKSLKFNNYLDVLLHKRNQVCDQVLETIARQHDEMLEDETATTKNRKKLLASSSPPFVCLSMPHADDPTKCEEIPVLFASDAKISVAVKLTEAVMDHLRLSISLAPVGERGKKRSRMDRVFPGFTGKSLVRYNYQRESCYITYCDADGRQHTKHSKPKFDHRSTDEEKNEAIRLCSEQLSVFFEENNVTPEGQCEEDDSQDPPAEEPQGI